ncbi:hypothetical protein [Aureibacter tunicatorum]|uniref:Uncharacterized protein n=1 Tax=Aureibacter tunicatorum TaxID=866807 RepID=A0AAE3XNP1_9BACT|nr:hypothetical protein [Aureibacter tunicatorum]MDR6239220.1 hypothetical protein [Aureibacter tunicatorum]BDD04855.1 hypothetical protein AUTU_23380 [Aureibacter tunicatorum]
MSKSYYLNRYRNKQSKELQTIINNSDIYESDAIEAAHELLEGKLESDIRIKVAPKIENNSDDEAGYSVQGEIRSFFKTFSYREVLIMSTISVLIVLYNYFLDEYLNLPGGVIAIAAIALMHISYKFLHKRSNSYAGRCIMDMIFFVVYLFISVIMNNLLYEWYTIDLSSVSLFSIAFFTIVPVALFELIYSLFKALLNKFGIDIL